MSTFERLFPAQAPVSRREILLSAVAAGLTLSLNAWISQALLPGDYRVFLAASMGASTILAIVLYHSPLSQPWAILGGHLTGALAGLLAFTLFADPVTACAVGMGLTILLQLSLRCLHAPGGGTALLPILGGSAVQAEGIGFLLVVLLNVLVLLAAAFAFNNLLPGRGYPLAFVKRPPAGPRLFSEAELRAAMRDMDGILDIDPEDLEQIYEIASRRLREAGEKPAGATPAAAERDGRPV
jgi:CBS-domain-containing membrane protein